MPELESRPLDLMVRVTSADGEQLRIVVEMTGEQRDRLAAFQASGTVNIEVFTHHQVLKESVP